MATPHGSVRKATAARLETLGYSLTGESLPAVVIGQMTDSPYRLAKDSRDYEITFLLDIVTTSRSVGPSLDILEEVRRVLDTPPQIEGYTVNLWSFEECSELQEIDTTQGVIWRQLQRMRIILTTD